MKMFKVLVLLMLAAWASLSFASDGPTRNVSLVSLLASPEHYNDVRVSVSGILHKDADGRLALYLDSGSAKAEIWANAFALLLAPTYKEGDLKRVESEGQDRYVMVFGVVDTTPPQPRLFAGLINKVDAIRVYPLIRSLPQTATSPQ